MGKVGGVGIAPINCASLRQGWRIYGGLAQRIKALILKGLWKFTGNGSVGNYARLYVSLWILTHKLAQGWRRVGAGLAQGWRRVGAGLAQGWRRVGAGLAQGVRVGFHD